ncbi:MAG: hypothetical protein SH857_02225 [Chitinophagales bacterium]|nr:hypothetical protein [Chitinophagales bacterium]
MATKRKNKPKGFNYYLEDEQLLAFSKWSLVEKLTWLEEINEFMSRVQTKQSARVMEMFKSGKI